MRFRPAALRLGLRFGVCLTATFSAGASFAAFFVGVGFTTSFAALAVAQRFFAASEILFRAVGLSFRRLVFWAGAAAFVTGVALLTPDRSARTSWSFPISASIASMIEFVTIAASLGEVFVYRNTIPRRLSFERPENN
jgi:hypothetical protein